MVWAVLSLPLAAQDDTIKGALDWLKSELPKTNGGNQKVDYCYIGLAFLAQGSTLTEGDYCAELKKCFDGHRL